MLQRFPKQPPRNMGFEKEKTLNNVDNSVLFSILQRLTSTTVPWHWPKFTKTAIGQSIKHDHMVGGRHEGLLLTRNACNHIVPRMASQSDAYDENCCMEEFVFQSLSMECGEPYLQLMNIDLSKQSPLVIVDASWKQKNPENTSNKVVYSGLARSLLQYAYPGGCKSRMSLYPNEQFNR